MPPIRRKKNKFEKESLQFRKNLSLRLPFFPLNDLSITNHILRNIFKYSFTKKIKRMTFEVDVFPYFAHHIPNTLRQITLKRLRFSSTTSSFRFNKKLAIRSLESQKHLKRLKVNENVSLGQIKAARKMPNLEHFSFVISENDIPSLCKIFRGPSRLHTVELMIQKNRDWISPLPLTPEQVNMAWTLLKDLVKLKKLKTLRLTIEACAFTEDPAFFYRLLGVLGESNSIETLDLTLHLINLQETELNERAKRILSQLQDLDIKSSKHRVIYTDFNEIPHKEKKIRISFLPDNQQDSIDISKLLAKCPALKTLVLNDDFGNLIVSPGSQQLNAKLELLKVCIDHKEDEKTLELLRYLSSNSQLQHILDLNMGLYHFTDEILEELIKINSSFSASEIKKYSIYTQDVYHHDANSDETERANFFSKLPRSKLFCQIFESISRLTSLTSLDVFTRFEEIDTIESLANSLTPLQNLQHLKIQIYEKDKTHHDQALLIDMPVYNLRKLQSFSLRLSFNFRFRDFFGFLDKMAEVQELEFFALDCIDIDPKNEESMQKIAKTLNKFPNCKRMYVDRNSDDESLCLFFIDAESKQENL